MAIQLPDVGTGVPADQTGDSPWLAMKKVRENFANPDHAASKTIGVQKGQVSLNDDLFRVMQGATFQLPTSDASTDANTLEAGDRVYFPSVAVNAPINTGAVVETFARFKSDRKYQLSYSGLTNIAINDFYYRFGAGDSWGEWLKIYSTGNTDEHGTNGYLKPSSPILKIEADKMWANADGEAMGATYTKMGVGDYEISNTTGLRSDGWYIEIPNDLHGNPHVAVTIEDTEGTIHLKCFKRVFNMDTFKFEPDLESPMDIPEGRWIDLRFNEIPVEAQEELPTDGG